MTDNRSLIKLSGLGKPAAKLIEAVQAGIGALYEPTRMRREARAQVDVRNILAEGDADLAERTARRIAFQEARRQQNIDAVVGESIRLLPQGDVDAAPIDPDWTARFFESCQDVSDAQLRRVWARILAGEFSTPGSFSRRSLTALREMDKHDAELFGTAAQLIWVAGDSHAYLPLALVRDPQVEQWGINLDAIMQLEMLGLLHVVEGLYIQPDPRHISYFGEEFSCESVVGEHAVRISAYAITDVGEQLAGVTGAAPDPEYKADAILAMARYDHLRITPLASESRPSGSEAR